MTDLWPTATLHTILPQASRHPFHSRGPARPLV